MNLTRNNQRARKGRCFLCRTSTEVVSLFTSAASMLNPNASWSKSCLESMCRLISIPDKHPCKQFITSGSYCADCIQLIRDIDFTLKSLDNFQQQILGFREDLFTKLGDNYKAIPNPNLINVNPEDIQRSKISGKVVFGFDEVIKITFNKIEKEKCKWTRTDFMKGAASDSNNSINTFFTSRTCNRKVSTKSKAMMKVNSIDAHTTAAREKGREVINKYNRTSDVIDGGGEDHENSLSKESGNDPVVPVPSPCDENDNDPDWVASDDDAEMFDDPENDSKIISESENNNKSHSLVVKDGKKVPTTSIKLFKCPEVNCDVSLGNPNAVKIHVRKAHEGDPKPYHCNLCELRFQYDASLIIHKKSHQSQSTLQCSLCNLKFGSKHSLKVHMKKIHRIFKPECQYCGVEFEKEDHMEHEKLHRRSDTPFKCLTCELMFTNSVDLKRHMHTHDSATIICDVCGILFRSELALLSHRKHIHDPSFVEFKCNVCGLRCKSKSSLETHMAIHSHEKKFVCDVCGDAFKQKSSFDRHRRRHLNIFPFSCKICGKRFTWSGPLKTHEETHSGIFAYDCPACGKKFKTRANLKQHKNKHCPNIERSNGSSSKKRIRKKKNTAAAAITDEESNYQTNTASRSDEDGSIGNQGIAVGRNVKFPVSNFTQNQYFSNNEGNNGEDRTNQLKYYTGFQQQNPNELYAAVLSIAR